MQAPLDTPVASGALRGLAFVLKGLLLVGLTALIAIQLRYPC
jgi:hypothetical protein